jgi:solute:Na+ symporter, SSS family
MSLGIIDWIIIVLYLLVSLGIGLYYRERAGKSLGEFFLGGRSLPWHVAGISMVATTFAADTPLAVNEIVYKNGISGNWLWWCSLFGGMLTALFRSDDRSRID